MGIVKFATETGSIYEVDEDAKKMRRVSGKHEPTYNQREDGEWREYEEISEIKIGERLLTIWGPEEVKYASNEAMRKLVLRRTQTSRITEIIRDRTDI